ncbi:MAG TPA: DUF4363 family protein [Firmicutes bacterium]|nr:DUF4363 family protein [Bacillota bacterium]
MKRLIVALALLLSVAVLCALSLLSLDRNTDFLLSRMDEMQEAYKRGDAGSCLALSEEFVQEFDERTRFFPFFMRHSDISKIEESVIVLPVMLRSGEEAHWISELAKCRSQLEKLADMETLTLENIL